MPIKINKGQSSGPINVVPMVDVIFQLLLFFLVVGEFIEEDRTLPVALPQASEATPLSVRPKEMVVNVDQKGRYYVSGKYLSARALEDLLRQASASNPGRQSVEIRADKLCQWEHVLSVMNLCNKAKIRDYRVAAAQPSAPG